MKGLELGEKYYKAFGDAMLKDFPELTPYLAVGLVGEGSECFGFDDEISRDHDFEPGFCIFLPGEEIVSRRDAFLLEKKYLRLPKEYEGYRRSPVNPVGGSRHGIFRTEEFYEKLTGKGRAPETYAEWKCVPEYARAQATNGKVFFDHYGEFSAIREKLLALPEDVRKKRIAGYLLLAAQSGPYNYERILKHGEKDSAQLSLYEYVKAMMRLVFLLNQQPMPFYKWSFRAMRALPVLSELAVPFSGLLTRGNEPPEAEEKEICMEQIKEAVLAVLHSQNLTDSDSGELEIQAYEVQKKISDPEVRNLHILDAIET